MRDAELFELLSPEHVVAATLFGTAGEPTESQVTFSRFDRIGVANVIGNVAKTRREAWRPAVKAVALEYPCWRNGGVALDAARAFHLGDDGAGPVSRECLELAKVLVVARLGDVTVGATRFLLKDLYESDHADAWAIGKLPTMDTGAFVFFR